MADTELLENWYKLENYMGSAVSVDEYWLVEGQKCQEKGWLVKAR